jgi:hypothetical protein
LQEEFLAKNGSKKSTAATPTTSTNEPEILMRHVSEPAAILMEW